MMVKKIRSLILKQINVMNEDHSMKLKFVIIILAEYYKQSKLDNQSYYYYSFNQK